MREYKLRSGVNWQGALKQKGVKQMGVKCAVLSSLATTVTVFHTLITKLA
jgi:hypothetical protein